MARKKRITLPKPNPTLIGNISFVIKEDYHKTQYFCLVSEFDTLKPNIVLDPNIGWVEDDKNGEWAKYSIVHGATQELIDNMKIWQANWEGVSIAWTFIEMASESWGENFANNFKYITKIIDTVGVIEKKAKYYAQNGGNDQLIDAYERIYNMAHQNLVMGTDQVAKDQVIAYELETGAHWAEVLHTPLLTKEYKNVIHTIEGTSGRSKLEKEMLRLGGQDLLSRILISIYRRKPDFIERPRMALRDEHIPAHLKGMLAHMMNIYWILWNPQAPMTRTAPLPFTVETISNRMSRCEEMRSVARTTDATK